jgi:hypothetical protein
MKPGKLRPTNSADDSKGEFAGLEGSLAFWPAGFLFAGILVFSVLTRASHVSFLFAGVLCFSPGLIVAAICYTMINKKPPGHFWDWISSYILGRTSGSYCPHKQPTRSTD